MSEPIGPGDWVEVVQSTDRDHIQLPLGSLWRVSAMESTDVPGCSENPECLAPIIDLVGQPICDDIGFCACGFRPIYRPSSFLIESLKAKCRTGAIVDGRDNILIPVSK